MGQQTAPGKPTHRAEKEGREYPFLRRDPSHGYVARGGGVRGTAQQTLASDKSSIWAWGWRPGSGAGCQGRPAAPQAAFRLPTPSGAPPREQGTLVTPFPRQQKSDTRNRKPKPEPRPPEERRLTDLLSAVLTSQGGSAQEDPGKGN